MHLADTFIQSNLKKEEQKQNILLKVHLKYLLYEKCIFAY